MFKDEFASRRPVPALLTHSRWTLSNKPRLALRRDFIEGDPYYYWVMVTNDGSVPFPPSEMIITAQWKWDNDGTHETTIHLAKGELAPGAFKWEGATVGVRASGYAMFHVQYTPYSKNDGSTLHDTAKRELDYTGKYAIDSFRGTSLLELRTLTALYLAAIAAVASAAGLLLTLIR
jgi:hypothetical protein